MVPSIIYLLFHSYDYEFRGLRQHTTVYDATVSAGPLPWPLLDLSGCYSQKGDFSEVSLKNGPLPARGFIRFTSSQLTSPSPLLDVGQWCFVWWTSSSNPARQITVPQHSLGRSKPQCHVSAKVTPSHPCCILLIRCKQRSHLWGNGLIRVHILWSGRQRRYTGRRREIALDGQEETWKWVISALFA